MENVSPAEVNGNLHHVQPSQNPLAAVAQVELLAERGWKLFPCAPRSKKPIFSDFFAKASSDPLTISGWAAKYPDCNWAVVTGPRSRVFVLDVDGEKGRASLATLEGKHGPLPDTLTSRTGRADSGEHRWFNWPPDRNIRSRTSHPAEKLDVRGAGGYVIVPPSIHETGRIYQWENSSRPPADAPDWLLDLLTEKSCTDSREPSPKMKVLKEGRRNVGLFRRACAMRSRGALQEEIERRLLNENNDACVPPLLLDEVRRIAASAARYPPGGLLGTAWKKVLNEPHSRGYEQFLALARHLQLARPGQSIALPLESIGKQMDCHRTQVGRWRRRAEREGWLILHEKYIRNKKAALYFFSPNLSPYQCLPIKQTELSP
jgi:hypothetical protein